MKNNHIKKLNFRDKVIKRPARYIGSTKEQKHFKYIVQDNKIIYKECSYVPGLLKIFREPFDNCIDEAIRTNYKFANIIDINIKDSVITIKDNGRGIPSNMGKDENNKPIPIIELAWCHLDAGSNFDDEEDNQTLGQNGEGVCLTNIFSEYFYGETFDKIKVSEMKCSNNMERKNLIQKDKKTGRTYTKVTFKPDSKKFSDKNIHDLDHLKLIYFDILTCAINYPKIKFKLNGKNIISNFNGFCSMLSSSEKIEQFSYKGLDLAIYPSDTDFNFIHFINGLNVSKGGSPLNWCIDNIVDKMREKLERKCKGIKPSDIKNKLSLVLIFSGMFNPRFEDQAKTICENNYTQFKSQIGDIDWNKITDKIIKNKNISQPIIDLFLIKQKAEEAKLLKKGDKDIQVRKVLKYMPSFKSKKGLVISEGDSAIDSVVANVGRDHYGFMPSSGVPLNSLEKSAAEIQKSDKFKDMVKVLNIKYTGDNSKLVYDSIILSMDADYDGLHIIGLYLAYFYRFCPEYLFNKKIFIFRTPVAMLKDNNDNTKQVFLTQQEYNEYFKTENKKYKAEMKKGLGSLSDKEWEEFFKFVPFEKALEPLTFKDKSEVQNTLINWLGKDKESIAFRKKSIHEYRLKGKLC